MLQTPTVTLETSVIPMIPQPSRVRTLPAPVPALSVISTPEPADVLEQAIRAYIPAPSHAPADSKRFRRLAMQLLDWTASAPLGRMMPEHSPRELVHCQILGTSMRSIVLRLRYRHARTGQVVRVVVKHFRRRDSLHNSGGFGLARELASARHFSALTDGVLPGYYTHSDGLRAIVLEDSSASFADPVPLARALSSDDSVVRRSGFRALTQFYAALGGIPVDADAALAFRRELASLDKRSPFPGGAASFSLASRGAAKLFPQGSAEGDTDPYTQLRFAFKRIAQPVFLARGTLASDELARAFAATRGADYMVSTGDFNPENVLCSPSSLGFASAVSSDAVPARGVDAEGSAFVHRGMLFAEVMLGFPSSPAYPGYRVERERDMAPLYVALWGSRDLDADLALDITLCTLMIACTLIELYARSERAALLPVLCSEAADFMQALLAIALEDVPEGPASGSGSEDSASETAIENTDSINAFESLPDVAELAELPEIEAQSLSAEYRATLMPIIEEAIARLRTFEV